MKKIGLIFLFLSFCFLLGCDDVPVSETKSLEISQHNYIDVKYSQDPVDIYGFKSFDTSRSSFIEEAYYDERAEYLILNLTGTYYHRCGVPSYIWEEFKEADTLGGYFNKHIKGEYACYDLKAKEEEEKKAEEERLAREAEEAAAAAEMQRQAEIQKQQAQAKKQMCDNLIAEANKEIADIQSKKLSDACNLVNAIESDISMLQNRMNNLQSEANTVFDSSTPQYIKNSYVSNRTQEIKNELSILENRYYSALSRCSDEQNYNRKFDELILQRQAMVVNKGC